jgi:hypothetical protein
MLDPVSVLYAPVCTVKLVVVVVEINSVDAVKDDPVSVENKLKF